MIFTMMKSILLSAVLARSVNAIYADEPDELCFGKTETTTKLDFFNSELTDNTLHEGGTLTYSNIGFVGDSAIDLVVSVIPDTTYYSKKAEEKNGLGGKFGNINLYTEMNDFDSGEGNFRFCLHDHDSGEITTADSFLWSVYDVDERNAAVDGIKEKMIMDISQATDYFLYPNAENSELVISCEGSDSPPPCADGVRTVFHSSTDGKGCDNPDDPNNMTEQQKKRSIVFAFKDVSCWDFTYDHYCRIEQEEGGTCTWYGGGNFLFAGEADGVVEEGECIVASTDSPTTSPTESPTSEPTKSPTKSPTESPTTEPTKSPTKSPTESPTTEPTKSPTKSPTESPTTEPTKSPTKSPTESPTTEPTKSPTKSPTESPTTEPTKSPTIEPTKAPSDEPTVVAEGSSCLQDTQMDTELDFFNSELTENTLHENGILKYENIGVIQDRSVDLIVSVVPDTSYYSKKAEEKNGKDGKFGNINLFTIEDDLDSGKGSFRFCFHDHESGELATANSFMWSVYDLDERNAASDGIKEKMIMDVSQATDYFLYPNMDQSEIEMSCEFSGLPPPCEQQGERVVFHSSTQGTGSDNPDDPNELTEQQKKRSVVFAFQDVSCWDFTYEHYCAIEAEFPEEGKCSWYGGGNFLFAGNAKGIVEEGECLGVTNSPTIAPKPSEEPTPDFEKFDEPTPTDYKIPEPECPNDVKVLKTSGVTEFPTTDAVSIVSKDTETVTVLLNQVWDSNESIDSIFYQYNPDDFDTKCYEVDDVAVGSTYTDEVTIQCLHMNHIAKLKICLADSLEKEFLTMDDEAEIPKCCHSEGVPADTPVVCYTLEINCKPGCPEDETQQAFRSLRGAK